MLLLCTGTKDENTSPDAIFLQTSGRMSFNSISVITTGEGNLRESKLELNSLQRSVFLKVCSNLNLKSIFVPPVTSRNSVTIYVWRSIWKIFFWSLGFGRLECNLDIPKRTCRISSGCIGSNQLQHSDILYVTMVNGSAKEMVYMMGIVMVKVIVHMIVNIFIDKIAC